MVLFHHDESGKILNQILLEVLMNCTKHFDLSSSLTASCVARFIICWLCRLYFSGLVWTVIIGCWGKSFGCFKGKFWEHWTNGNVFDAWRKWFCGVVYVWPRTNSVAIVSMFIWFCYLEWMMIHFMNHSLRIPLYFAEILTPLTPKNKNDALIGARYIP